MAPRAVLAVSLGLWASSCVVPSVGVVLWPWLAFVVLCSLPGRQEGGR